MCVHYVRTARCPTPHRQHVSLVQLKQRVPLARAYHATQANPLAVTPQCANDVRLAMREATGAAQCAEPAHRQRALQLEMCSARLQQFHPPRALTARLASMGQTARAPPVPVVPSQTSRRQLASRARQVMRGSMVSVNDALSASSPTVSRRFVSPARQWQSHITATQTAVLSASRVQQAEPLLRARPNARCVQKGLLAQMAPVRCVQPEPLLMMTSQHAATARQAASEQAAHAFDVQVDRSRTMTELFASHVR